MKEYLYVATNLETLIVETDMPTLFADTLTYGYGDDRDRIRLYRLTADVYAYLHTKLERLEAQATAPHSDPKFAEHLAFGLARWAVVQRWVNEQWSVGEIRECVRACSEVSAGKRRVNLPAAMEFDRRMFANVKVQWNGSRGRFEDASEDAGAVQP